jgi:hypothetical protein
MSYVNVDVPGVFVSVAQTPSIDLDAAERHLNIQYSHVEPSPYSARLSLMAHTLPLQPP